MVNANKPNIRVNFVINDAHNGTHHFFKISLNILVLEKLDTCFSDIFHLLPSAKK